MRPVFTSLLAICTLALGSAVSAQQPTTGVFGLKLPVSNFDRSVAYYTKYFPLKADKVYNAGEMALASSEPTSTQRPITLWLDKCATPAGRAMLAKAPPATDAIHSKLHACTANFRAGTSWLFIMVPDAARVSAQLKADGHEATLVREPASGPGYLLFLTEDPDGNVVEAVQALSH